MFLLEFRYFFQLSVQVHPNLLSTLKQQNLFYLIIQNQQSTTMKQENQLAAPIHNSFRIKLKSHKSRTFHIAHYQIAQLIGKGGFATVYKGVELHTKQQIAVKVVNLQDLTHKDLQHLRREISIHHSLDHPHIVKIYQAIWTQSHVYIFMELVKGIQLFDHLNKNGPLKQSLAAKIFSQIVSAVQHMHSLNIAHRDIKTENIIIDSDFNAKLIDFGLAKMYNSPKDDYLQTFCGSPSYVSPELLQNRRYSGQRVDIWCLGVTLYVMLEACLPFDNFDRKSRQYNIHNLNWHQPLYSSGQAIQLYCSIFKEQRVRVSMNDIKNSLFFSKYHLKQIKSKSTNLDSLTDDEKSSAIKKTSLLLNVQEQQVKNSISSKDLGQIYCVFQILSSKESIQKFNQKRYSKSERKSVQITTRHFNTVQPKSTKTKEKERPKSRHQSSLIKILPVIQDPVKIKQKQVAKWKRNNIEQDHYNIQILSKGQIAKDILKSKGHKKNLFSKDLCIKQLKPRLREDSPESPKRILDCLKIYN